MQKQTQVENKHSLIIKNVNEISQRIHHQESVTL